MSSEYENNRGDIDDEDREDSDDDDSLDDDSDQSLDDDDEGDDDATSEYSVDEIFAKLDSTDPNEVAHRREVRRRLEEIAERRNQDLDSTFNFNLDDDF